MANEMTVGLEDIIQEIRESLTVNGFTPSEEAARFVWGNRAYNCMHVSLMFPQTSITNLDYRTNNVPCVPATDIMVHAHGEQFPMHRSVFLQIFGNSVKWPIMDGYNLDCFIPAHHFRALHRFAYTGSTYSYITYMIQELFVHLRPKLNQNVPYMGLDMEGMMAETPDTRLSVARHILEFVMILEAAGCGNSPSVLADDAFNQATEFWFLMCECEDLTDDITNGLEKDIERDLQGWHDEISLPYQLKSLELDVSSHARL